MISITDFSNFLDTLVANIDGIDTSIATPKEQQIVKRIKDIDGVILVGVIPSADAQVPDIDNYSDNNITFFFVVEKIDTSNVTATNELEHYQKLQTITENLKKYIVETAQTCHFLRKSKPETIHMDPEYQIFGGYNGWSFSFQFQTDGF